ncbi:MAG: FAD-dependent oxidoreductase, partial [bacterium]|nr:FAD-dependent oxidoreductase [bacterium]
PEGDYATRDAIYDEYVRLTLGWFYFLQHDPSVPAVLRNDTLRWGLAKDEFADTNHLPFMLYVREARRIMGQYVFTELDATKNTTKPDSIGCGGYAIDSHHVKNFDRTNLHLEIPEGNERYGVKKGYQIPYRILVPQKVEGLLVSLCVSSTHLGYCTLRMEPEYMKMGQAAGAASYLAVQHKIPPEDIDVEELQEILRERGGVFLSTESVLPPDEIRTIPHDLVSPSMTTDAPAPGRRVRQVVPQYDGTGVHHALYLPTDWEKGKKYPVIVEYAGNGGYRGRFGDVCTGKVEDCNLGYGISGGEGFIWVCLPYISKDHAHNELNWWGDLEATAAYCKTVVPGICREYGGDPAAVFLAGFSRGSIACNFLGLHDDEIARLWRGFICHSHYDGIKKWDYAESDRVSAAERLERLEGRPQFISQEGSVEETRRYLGEVYPGGPFTFLTPPYRNHTDTWVLRDIPERESLRQWIQNILLMCGEPQRAG